MSSPESPEDVLERVLESLQDGFMKCVVAKAIAHKAADKKIIPQTVETDILNAKDDSNANHYMFVHLRSQATVKDLRELCSIMKDAKGNSRMIGFGETLEAELDKSFPRQENAAIDGRLMQQPRCGHCGAESGAVASPAENTSLSSCAKVQKVVERGEFEGLDSLADSFAITVGYIVGDLITESMLAPLKTVALNKVKLKRIPNPPSRADINNANDIQQLFDLLHIDSNWVDITLLEQIVKVSRSESAASNLSDYKKSHERVIADALACLVDPSTDGTCPRPDANSGILQLVFSDEREGMRVQEVLACKQFLCHRFGVQPESIKFLSAVISNSLVVTWLVSRHTGWKIVNQCRSPPVLAVLQEMEVIAVRLRYPGFSVGINVTLDASKGCAHMEEAVCSGALKQVQELTQKGVDMNEGNIMDKASDVRHSPLIVTIKEGHEDVALELLSAGVDKHVKDDDGRTALHWACEKGLEEVVEALISLGSYVDERDLFGLTPVMLAADSSKTEVSMHLVRAGASCEGLSKDHMKFLFRCACRGAQSDLTAVRTLLKKGCSVDILSKEKQEELLCHACHKGDMLVVEHLIGHGCSVSCVSVDGYTPLMLAAQEGHEEVVKKLILAGANVRTQDEHGNTALHYAAVNRHIQCGINLVEGGASVSVKNKSFEIPLDLAKDDFKEAVLQAMSYKTRKIISIIGNAAGGKSTLVTSLQSEGKVFSQLESPDDKPRQIAGIDTVTHCSQNYGEVLLFDFAGQHKYHGPQQMFLESLFSITGISVTILLVVNVTGKERTILNQLHHWLAPLALMDTPASPRVIIVGSFLDKVMFKGRATAKLTKCIEATRRDLEGLPLEILGSCLLNCCQPHSEGMDQLCRFLREIPILESTQKQYSLPWVLSQIRSFFKAPAVQLQELSEWIQDNKDRLPRTMPPPKEVCQDLSAAGHALYLPNVEDPAKSWLVLDLPIILRTVYGTLFSQTKEVANEFGLLPCQYLAELFPDMHQEMIEQLLISLKFCIPVDPSLLKIEVIQETEEASRWLFIPALISANPPQPTSEGLPQQSIHSLCWQLKASKKHFISAHVLQSILLHLAPHFIEKQGQKKVVQQQRHYRIWRNGIAWQPIVGVDVTVHISKEMIQVVTSSIKSADKLCQYLIDVIGDVISIVRRLSPKLAATTYIVHPPHLDALYKSVQVPSEKLYPMELVQSLVSNGEEHISLEKSNRTAIAISDLFEGRTPSLEDIGRLNWTEPKRIHLQSSVESSGAQRLQAVQRLGQVPTPGSVFLPASTGDATETEGQAGVTAQQVLDMFRDQFIQVMDSNAVVLDLLHHNIITEGDKRRITMTTNRTEQNKFLHKYLRENCTEDTFHLVCDIISDVQGNPKMSALGTAMKLRLETGPGQVPTPGSVFLPASTGGATKTEGQAGVTAQQVLDEFRDQFIHDMDSNAVVLHLLHHNIITEDDYRTITKFEDLTDQNRRLRLILTVKCTEDAFHLVCDIISKVKGHPRMSALGTAMKRRLETAPVPQSAALITEAHHKAKQQPTEPSTQQRSGQVPTPGSVFLPASTGGAAETEGQAGVTVQQVLDEFREQFIEEMDSNDVVLDLQHHGIITEGDQRTITRTEDPTEQNLFLHYCLKQKCTEDTLYLVCDIISDVKGNPKMSALGTAMKRRLETAPVLQSAPSITEAHPKAKQQHMEPSTQQIQQVLDEFREQFIQDMDSNAIVLDLLDHDIINRNDQRTITRTITRTEQNKFLHLYLKEKCTEDALYLVCDIMSDVKGNPKMNALGTAMKRRLKTAPAPQSAPSITEAHPKAKQQHMEPSTQQTPVLQSAPSITEAHPKAKQQHMEPSTQQIQQVLDEFREQFIQDMDSNAVFLDLLHHGIISRGDQRTLTRTEDRTEQNIVLHYCLKQKCTEDAFYLVCDIISNVKGIPKMSALGTAMKRRLETAPVLQSAPSITEAHPKAKQQHMEPSTQQSSGLSEAGVGGVLSQRVIDRSDHLLLFRRFVSRHAAGKGRAVLEGLGLDYSIIRDCYVSNPQDAEEAVQTGLIKWIHGHGFPPTWEVLISVMYYAEFPQQLIY